MPNNQVEEVKSKVDIVSIIGEHVKLTKSGSNFRGLCPFHNEKSPSFMVSEELQIYKCFGCGEGGDVFTFLEKYEGMDFPEALKYLADKAGITLTRSDSFEKSDKDIFYDINSLSAKFYNYLLVTHQIGKVALNYLKEERKITLDSIKAFNIGFAPRNKNVLSNFLIKKKKYKIQDLAKAGIIFVTKGGKIYDRFEGRIIFPISDNRGNVIALAGRQLPPGNPKTGKYINSPETPVYKKSLSLYGLDITKDFVKKEGFAVVVEGEIDLIASWQIGIKNIVAIKGSAFTVDQAKLLGRYVKDVVLALDTDFAGVAAAIRGIKILEDAEFDVRVAKLGKFKDPDDAAKANPEFYKEKVKSAVSIWDFIIDSVIAKYDKDKADGKRKISRELTPILAGINNKIVQEHYINKLAKLLEVSEEAVSSEVEKTHRPDREHREPSGNITISEHTNIREVREEKLIALILKIKPGLLTDKKVQILIETPFTKRILEEFIKLEKVDKEFNLKKFMDYLPKELSEKFGELILSLEIGEKKDESDEALAKAEINDLYGLLARDTSKAKLLKSVTSAESRNLQKEWKEFDSGEFQRIID